MGREKGITVINLGGLSLGMAAFLLIAFYFHHESSCDDFHAQKDDIYLVIRENRMGDAAERKAITGAPLAPLLLQDFPVIDQAVRFTHFGKEIVGSDEKRFHEERFFYADGGALNIFSFPLSSGDPEPLFEPFSLYLTPVSAAKYFGGSDPVGRTLQVTFNGRSIDYTVRGVLEPIPSNSHLQFDFLASYSSLNSVLEEYFFSRHWDSPTWTYVLLQDGASPEALDAQLGPFTERYVDKWHYTSIHHTLCPLKDVYFHAPGPLPGPWGNTSILVLLSSASLFVLLIACMNFMNLQTARSTNRAKEIGLRKTVGALKRQLITQFLSESVLYSLLSLLIALVIVEVFLPSFRTLVGTPFFVDYSFNSSIPAIILTTGFLVGLLAGIYPAFHLSAFPPNLILRGVPVRGRAGLMVRRVLVTSQFVLSVVFIIIVLLVGRQTRFLQNRTLGFDKESLVHIDIQDKAVRSKYNLLKSRWMSLPAVKGVTASSMIPGVTSQNGITIRDKTGEDISIGIIYVDADYLETMGIRVIQGRGFSSTVLSDASSALMMNENALQRLGWHDAIGREVELVWKLDRIVPMYQTTLIGITEDFHFRDLTIPMQPVLMKIDPRRYNHVFIRIQSGSDRAVLESLHRIWREFRFEQSFECTFLTDAMENVYRPFHNLSKAIQIAMFLSILIASLGLFGLASFMVEKRTKEIGIRKVLGASSRKIVSMITRDFLVLIVLANLLAWPAAYWIAGRLLESFAYRIRITPVPFVLALCAVLIVGLLSVSLQALRAAATDPSRTLRYE